MKDKKLLFVKLTGLTLAIYWFISKGGTQSIDTSLVMAYLVFAALRNLYLKNVRKPKSNIQKKYAKLRR